MRPYVEELSRIAPCFVSCHPNAGLPERIRRLRRNARAHAAVVVRVCRERLAEYRRRLLRHHARAHPRDRRRGGRARPARAAARSPGYSRFSGLEPLDPAARQQLSSSSASEPTSPARKNSRGSSAAATTTRLSRWPATRSPAEPTSSTSTWTRRCSTARRRWPRSSPDRRRARHRPRPR